MNLDLDVENEEVKLALLGLLDDTWDMIINKLDRRSVRNLRKVCSQSRILVNSFYANWHIKIKVQWRTEEDLEAYLNHVMSLKVTSATVDLGNKGSFVFHDLGGIFKDSELARTVLPMLQDYNRRNPDYLGECRNKVLTEGSPRVLEVRLGNELLDLSTMFSPLPVYDLDNLHNLTIYITLHPFASGGINTLNIMCHILERCNLPSLKSFTVFLNAIHWLNIHVMATNINSVLVLLARRGRGLDHFGLSCWGFAEPFPDPVVCAEVLQGCVTFKSLSINCRLLSTLWRQLVQRQTNLSHLEVTRMPVDKDFVAGVVRSHFESLLTVHIGDLILRPGLADGVAQGDIDLVIFQTCHVLKKLTLAAGQGYKRSMRAKNLNSLPESLTELKLNLIYPDEDEVRAFLDAASRANLKTNVGAILGRRF